VPHVGHERTRFSKLRMPTQVNSSENPIITG
jgi:hypothetical protein